MRRFTLAFALLLLALVPPTAPALAQEIPPSPPTDPAAQPAPPSVAFLGGCDSSAVSLSRPWVGRNAQLEWWAWGFARNTSVGVQLVDPTGRTTSMGSSVVDTICEASGVLPTEGRGAGLYTIVITGTRPGGAPVELSSSFRIVSLVLPVPGLPAVPQPTPARSFSPPTSCQATAATFCPQ